MNQIQMAGSQGKGSYAPLFTDRFFLGLVTNRNKLRSPLGAYYSKFINANDAMIDGQNVEVSNRLTLIRRPGNTAGLASFITSNNVPDIPLDFYSFHEINGTVRVFTDTATAPYLMTSSSVIPIFTKAAGAGQSFFQGIGQTLYFTDAKESQKWIDAGSGVAGNSFTTITNTALTSNVATITAVNNFQIGQTVVISGTTNGSGVFNGTFVITSVHPSQFTFNLTSSNVASASDTGFASATWNWGIAAPATAPTATIVASGSAATVWQASTVFSTMGLVIDGSGFAWQLISVNATGGNSTQFGTSGPGQPAWNQTPAGTTTDNTITWTNLGPVVAWTPSTTYRNFTQGGTLAQPCFIYDPVTKGIFGNRNASPPNTSGTTKPNFVGIVGADTLDNFFSNGPIWRCIAIQGQSTFPTLWQTAHNYPQGLGFGWANGSIVAEPTAIPTAGIPTNQTIFIQGSGGGTSAASATTPFPASPNTGTTTTDNQLIWLCQGSSTWTASNPYVAYSGIAPTFGVVKDQNGNLQICTISGKSGTVQPYAAWLANHAYSSATPDIIVDSNGYVQKCTTSGTSGVGKTLSNTALTSGVATYTTTANHGYSVGQFVTVTGSTNNAAFNVVRALIASVPTLTTFTIILLHDNITSGSDSGSVFAGPTWNTTVSGTTTDGTAVWTNQGAQGTGGLAYGWATAYGGKTADGTTGWVCVGQSMSWTGSTIWYLPVTGFAPPSSTQPYGGAQVIASATIQAVTQSGLSGTPTAPSFSTTTNNFVLDPATSNTRITWVDIGAQQTQSLAFNKGYSYVIAFKARLAADPYVTAVPPGGAAPLGPPLGSADGSVSTASPAVTFTGSNAGAVIVLSGLGSTDPQVDTISIFRTADGGATYFWLTDIANPLSINGIAQPWTFRDFLPDNANASFPGLNTLVLGPIGHFNDPPPVGLINVVQHLGRIFGSVGATVYCSEGPLVGGSSQPPGNGYTAFNPGQFWTFPSPVTRLVPAAIGLLVFTTSDLFIISGGPSVTALIQTPLIPGLGLTTFNGLTIDGSIVILYTSDNQVVSLDPSMGVSEIGFNIGDKLGAFSASSVYVAHLIQGSNDKALFVGDGSTGWYRCNLNQAPDSPISGPVWSPFALITGGTGAKALAALEYSPGKHGLFIGATVANKPILVRDSTFTTFQDNSTSYRAFGTIGSIVLANPGQLAELGFITAEFIQTGTSPKVLVLLDEISDADLNISSVSQSGNNTTYTYTVNSGISAATNMTLTVTGCSNSGNNGTFVVTGTGAGTFTVVNPNGATAGGQTAKATMFEDLSGYVSSITGIPPQDSPIKYGLQFQPFSIFANRYFFLQSINGTSPAAACCRHMQIKIDFGSADTVQNEAISLTIWGAHWSELGE